MQNSRKWKYSRAVEKKLFWCSVLKNSTTACKLQLDNHCIKCIYTWQRSDHSAQAWLSPKCSLAVYTVVTMHPLCIYTLHEYASISSRDCVLISHVYGGLWTQCLSSDEWMVFLWKLWNKCHNSQIIRTSICWKSVRPPISTTRVFFLNPLFCTQMQGTIRPVTSQCCECVNRRVAFGNTHSHPRWCVCVCVVIVWDRDQLKGSVSETWLWHSSSTLGISSFIFGFPNTEHEHMTLLFTQLFFEFHVYLLVLRLPVALSTFPFLLALTLCQAHTGDNSNSKQRGVKTNPFSHRENKPLSAFSLSRSLSLSLSRPYLVSEKINCSVSIYFT